jgi:hypothetical protein
VLKPRRTPPGAPHWVRPSAAPFPPPGPPRRVPRLRRYYGAVRLPGPLTPDSVAFARRYPAVRLSFRSQRSRSPNRGPGVRQPVPTSGTIRRETTRASQVPRQPCCPFARFSDPGRTGHTRPLKCASTAPVASTTKAPTTRFFRGSIARLWDWLSTLRGLGRPSTARKTRFRLLARLCRTGLVTRRVALKGFNASSTSSFPELSWRKDGNQRGRAPFFGTLFMVKVPAPFDFATRTAAISGDVFLTFRDTTKKSAMLQ